MMRISCAQKQSQSRQSLKNDISSADYHAIFQREILFLLPMLLFVFAIKSKSDSTHPHQIIDIRILHPISQFSFFASFFEFGSVLLPYLPLRCTYLCNFDRKPIQLNPQWNYSPNSSDIYINLSDVNCTFHAIADVKNGGFFYSK